MGLLKWIRRQRNLPKYPVIRKPGGHRAWKDKNPPRQDGWGKAILAVLAVLALCVVPFFVLGFYSMSRADKKAQTVESIATEEVTPEITEELTAEFTPESIVDAIELLPTATLTPLPLRIVGAAAPEATEDADGLPTPTITPLPLLRSGVVSTIPPMMQTLQFLQARETANAQPLPTIRAWPTLPLAASPTPRPVEYVQPVSGGGQPPVVIVETAPPVIITVEPIIIVQTVEPIYIVQTATPTEDIPPETTEEPTPTAIPLEVEFRALPADGLPLGVQFEAVVLIGSVTKFVWEFGDGGMSADAAPLHVYSAPGQYTVTLYAWSGAGDSVVFAQDIILYAPSTPTETPSPSPTFTDTPSPTPTATETPTPTPTATVEAGG